MNTQYLGKLFIGGQPSLLSFDTGSNWLAVTSNVGSAKEVSLAEHKPAYRPTMSRSSERVSSETVNEKYGST